MRFEEVTDRALLAPLFEGWPETMIWSWRDGCMGRAFAPAGPAPRSGLIAVGDFRFFAGEACPELAAWKPPSSPAFVLLAPQNEAWAKAIRGAFGARARPHTRYAFHKSAAGFDRAALARFAAALPAGYELRPIGSGEYRQALAADWGAADLCSQFRDFQDYCRRGLGFAALWGGELAAGASSYTVYKGGIEIEIDAHPAHRRKGLARALAARLMLECLDRGLFPSWDAHTPASAALAKRLGYRFDREYLSFVLEP